MPKASDLKRGDIVSINQFPHIVEELRITTPSARGASSLYHFRLRNLQTKNKLDQTCKGDDPFQACDFTRRAVQFSYRQNDEVVFMDQQDYSEVIFKETDIQDALQYITDDMEGIQALLCDGKWIGLELPPVAILKVQQCDPSIRGASATARTKPATLETGLTVQVPEYLEPHVTIRVDTRTAAFLGRA